MKHNPELYSMIKRIFFLVLVIMPALANAQTGEGKKIPKSKLPYVEKKVYINPKTGFVRGTQSMPRGKDTVLACLIIPGSGPTDRNGNNGNVLSTDAYKMLSDSLASRGFAVIRYDKHGVGDSRETGFSERAIRFENYVKDAAKWIKDMKADRNFKKVVVIGHSEGSLIGMLAADSSGADGFVSLAGTARSADSLILDQLKSQQLSLYEEAMRISKRIKAGEDVDTMSAILRAVYRPDVQGYLRSWFKYHPLTEIQKMKIPVLIIQGSTDFQVSVQDANALKVAKPDAELLIIKGMNHVLKTAPADKSLNMVTYFDKSLPLHPELIPALVAFLKKVEQTPAIPKK